MAMPSAAAAVNPHDVSTMWLGWAGQWSAHSAQKGPSVYVPTSHSSQAGTRDLSGRMQAHLSVWGSMVVSAAHSGPPQPFDTEDPQN